MPPQAAYEVESEGYDVFISHYTLWEPLQSKLTAAAPDHGGF